MATDAGEVLISREMEARLVEAVCVYCGATAMCEAEHVFPKSWYPSTTPESVQRLTVPSCGPCNDRWERIEAEFARDFLFVISPSASEVAGVHKRLTRAWQAPTGKTPRERRIRAGNAVKILRTMQWVPPAPGQPRATLRTFGGLYVRASPARRIEPQLLKAITEKFVRGLHYAETGEVLVGVRVHRAFLLTDERLADPDLAGMLALVQQLPINDSLGPGFWYRRHVQVEDGRSFWAFRIWGQITIVAVAELLRSESACTT